MWLLNCVIVRRLDWCEVAARHKDTIGLDNAHFSGNQTDWPRVKQITTKRVTYQAFAPNEVLKNSSPPTGCYWQHDLFAR